MHEFPSNSRTALITGTSRRLGLGYATARLLAEAGYHVVLTARNLGQADDLAQELRWEGYSASALHLDVSDTASIGALATALAKGFDHLDVLVNNASHMPDFQSSSAFDVEPDALRSMFEVNVFGCWSLTQALLPLLQKSPAARIVNVSSAAAKQVAEPQPGPLFSPAYSLAKFTLNGLTGVLAAALSNTKILVNAVDPGSVATHPERGDDEDDRSPAEAAKDVLWAATLGPNGPTGGFFGHGEIANQA